MTTNFYEKISDMKMESEYEVRLRTYGECWITKQKQIVPVQHMTDSHIQNSYSMLWRFVKNQRSNARYFNGLESCWDYVFRWMTMFAEEMDKRSLQYDSDRLIELEQKLEDGFFTELGEWGVGSTNDV